MKQNKHLIPTLLIAALSAFSSDAFAQNGTISYSAYTGTQNIINYGTSKKEKYDVAIMIADQFAKGKKIEAINVPIAEGAKIENIKVWITKKLAIDGSKNNVADVMTIDGTLDGSTITGKLAEPYTIDSDTLYVGYTFDVADLTEESKQPVVLVEGKKPQGFWIHSSRTFRSWMSKVAYGTSAIEVALSGANANAVGFNPINKFYGQINTPTTASITLINHGYNGIKSVDYSYSVGDGAATKGHVDLETPVAAYFGLTTPIDITLPSIATKGNYQVKFTVDKVNGEANADAATMTSVYNVYTKLPKRNPVMEEYTGTWCGWCPRGWVALEVMNHLHPDFIAISYHYGDTIQVMSDKDMPTAAAGYPSAFMDRAKGTLDPYYGNANDGLGIETVWKEHAAVMAPAYMEAEAELIENGNKIATKAKFTFPEDATDGNKYNVEFVILADSLRGEGNAWLQHNYYQPNQSNEMPWAEADRFFTGADNVGNMYYNDVIVGTTRLTKGLIALPAAIEADKTLEIESEIGIDELTNVGGHRAFQDTKNLRVVALLLNADGTIANGAKGKVTGYETTGINTVNGNANNTTHAMASAAIYNLQGHRMQTMQKGINIIRMANGKTKKVIK